MRTAPRCKLVLCFLAILLLPPAGYAGENSRRPGYSSEFEDYEQGCSDIRTCYWATVAFGPRNISLAPDITVDLSFDDYVSGRDPVLEKALERAR